MRDLHEIYRKIDDLILKYTDVDWGVADISRLHPLGEKYPRALSLVFRFDYPHQDYDEEAFHKVQAGRADEIAQVVHGIKEILDAEGVEHYSIPAGQDEEKLLGVFPHKLAAVRGGLGWIGKSSMLVSRKYGAMVWLDTILLDGADLPAAEPVVEGRCGDCIECVEACPHGCITGTEWTEGMDREKLLDTRLCNQKRVEKKKEDGRKDACGLCMLICKTGKK